MAHATFASTVWMFAVLPKTHRARAGRARGERDGIPDIFLSALPDLTEQVFAMPNVNRKQQAHALIDKLPDSATWDDMMRELYEHQAIERGLADSDADRVTDNKTIRTQYGLSE